MVTLTPHHARRSFYHLLLQQLKKGLCFMLRGGCTKLGPWVCPSDVGFGLALSSLLGPDQLFRLTTFYSCWGREGGIFHFGKELCFIIAIKKLFILAVSQFCTILIGVIKMKWHIAIWEYFVKIAGKLTPYPPHTCESSANLEPSLCNKSTNERAR